MHECMRECARVHLRVHARVRVGVGRRKACVEMSENGAEWGGRPVTRCVVVVPSGGGRPVLR